MKNAFMIFPIFFLNIIAWSLLCPFFYGLARPESFYAIVSGHYALFLTGVLENSLLFIPTGIVIAFFVVCVFIMRHGAKKSVAIPVSIFLFVLTVGVLVPLSLMIHQRLFPESAPAEEAGQLAEAGFIRSYEQGKKLLWLKNIEENTAVSNLTIADFSGNETIPRLATFKTAIFDRENRELRTENKRFPISFFNPDVERKLNPPDFLTSLERDIKAINSEFSASLHKSATAYIFISGAFFSALASLFFLCVLTDWKLINILLYVAVLRLVYKFFPLFCRGEIHNFLKEFLPDFFSDEMVSALPALIFAVLLSVAGFFFFLPRYKKKNPKGAGA